MSPILRWKMPRAHRDNATMIPLSRAFYGRNTVRVAEELLGKILVRRLGRSVLEGVIVETEAYRGRDDPASHAYRGPTRRNEVMFGESGRAYVYFTYGMHYCLNVTTENIGEAGAVLIRAVQPVRGMTEMKKLRRREQIRDLCNGPAKLTQAFAVTAALNGHDLTLGEKLYITEASHAEPLSIKIGTRIGIRMGGEKLWRFLVEDNQYVSRR